MRALLIAVDGTMKERKTSFPPKPCVHAVRRKTTYPAYLGEADETVKPPVSVTMTQRRIFVLVRETFTPARDSDLAIYVEESPCAA